MQVVGCSILRAAHILSPLKNKKMKKINYLILSTAFLGTFLLGCEGVKKNNPPVRENIFPNLLERTSGTKFTLDYENSLKKYADLIRKIKLNPLDISSRLNLVALYIQEARITGEHGYYYPQALVMTEQVLQQPGLTDDNSVQAMILKAHILLAQHEFSQALPIAEKAHQLQPYNAQVFTALIDAHVELGHYQEAVRLADELMALRPNLMGYARVSYLRELYGDLDGAIEAMTMAVEAGYPGVEDTEWARVKLGELYERQGNWSKAENAYRSSLAARENYAFAQGGLAKVLLQQKKFVEAENLLLTALESVPEIEFQENLYRCYRESGQQIKAKEAYQGIITMIQDDAAKGHQVGLDYAQILFELGEDVEAALHQALSEYTRRPANAKVNTLLSKLYLAKGEKELARKYLAEAKQAGVLPSEIMELSKKLG